MIRRAGSRFRSATRCASNKPATCGLAVFDLEDAMRRGTLRAMRRDLATGERARVERGFWRRGHVMPDTGCFFVWKPDLDVLLRALKR